MTRLDNIIKSIEGNNNHNKVVNIRNYIDSNNNQGDNYKIYRKRKKKLIILSNSITF